MRKPFLPALVALLAGAPAVASAPAPQLPSFVAAAQSRLMSQRATFGLNERHGFSALRAHRDDRAEVHTRFNQTYQGVPVFGGQVIEHTDVAGNTLKGATAHVHSNIQIDVNPAVTAAEALAAAHRNLSPRGTYAYEPTAELVVFPVTEMRVKNVRNLRRGGLNAEDVETTVKEYRLAYHVRMTLMNTDIREIGQWDLMVDAQTGKILKKWDSFTTADARGTGKTQFNGTVTLFTNSTTSGFELKDMTRGTGGQFGGNATTNMNKGGSTSTGSPTTPGTLFTDADNTWGDGANYDEVSATTSANGQTAAADAHYATQVTWDLMKNVFGRNGIDGTGKATYNRVHFASAWDNAFWLDACFCMSYGDGSSMKTLTSMDVGAHEMGHGICANSAALVYSGESGGLNEGNSDIIGALAELYARSGASGTTLPSSVANNDAMWTMGEQLSSSPLRYMYKPSKDGSSPDQWSSSLGNLDVHYSSGPINRMFFFLSQGSSATSSSDYYSSKMPNGMTGIGPDRAGRIWMRALQTYMTSSTNYAAARTACISAVKDLYGANSVEEQAVWNAFAAINVGSAWTGGTTETTPAITTQPVTQTVSAGSSVTFTVAATGGNLAYQWYKNGAAVSGATSASYTFTAQAADNNATFYATAKNTKGTATSSTATLIVNTTPGGELMKNGGFESGATSWAGTTGAIGTWTQYPAYEGTKNAWLGGNGKTVTETLSQAVAIPSTITGATLSFYLKIATAETGTTAYDKLTVTLKNAAGTTLKTLATYSNANAGSAYVLRSFDVSAYKGQTVTVHFNAAEDSTLQTSFLVDKVSLATR